ncbi:MAG: VanW family protein, partial [Firmicutes bacterium]|nr:VanW family protein [Bacillota bacterium]
MRGWVGWAIVAAILLAIPLANYWGLGPFPLEDKRGKKTGNTLPWEEEPRFSRAQRRGNTPLLLATYRAKLPDPILFERHNITLAAHNLQGALLEPGQVFSLNDHLGERTLEKGFKEGPMYSEGQIVEIVGGGVCKISSLLYNVAVLANMEIIERNAHSMLVPYVPPGQDATLCYGTKDFKFRNTSPDSILIWAENIDDTLYMALYSNHKGP